MFKVFSILFVSLMSASAFALDCKQELLQNPEACEALTVDGIGELLNVEESAYENPSNVTAVQLIDVMDEDVDYVELVVQVKYQTIYPDDGADVEVSDDTCDVRLEIVDEKWTAVYGYCYEQGKEFENN